MLHRKGNKTKLATKIIRLFPEHDCYIEPFFGTGSIFFSKPKVRYNILNDIDEDVFNLHQQLQFNSTAFKLAFENAIIHEKLIKNFKNKPPAEPLQRAVQFLICANFSLMSAGGTMKIERNNQKVICLQKIDAVVDSLKDALFSNKDWKKFFDAIGKQTLSCKSNFCYVDPPYLGSKSYKSNFIEQDAVYLLGKLTEKNLRFAYSEFDNPFILSEASNRGLTVHTLGERRNLLNRRVEILITNY